MAGAIKSVIVISGGTNADRKTIEQAAKKAARDIMARRGRGERQVAIKIFSWEEN